MSELLIVQNISREGPGLLQDVLIDNGVSFDVANLDADVPFPSLSGYKGLVVLGGPDSANDNTPKMTNEVAQVRAALEAGFPYLGICLGLQVGVKAAGGAIVPGKVKEVGFTNQAGEQQVVTLTDAGRQDPLFEGLDDALSVFQLHGETVELTDNMQLLATGKDCTNQVVRIQDKAYGIQSHFELTPEMLTVWAQNDPDLIPVGEEALQAAFASINAEYSQIGRALLTNFLKIATIL